MFVRLPVPTLRLVRVGSERPDRQTHLHEDPRKRQPTARSPSIRPGRASEPGRSVGQQRQTGRRPTERSTWTLGVGERGEEEGRAGGRRTGLARSVGPSCDARSVASSHVFPFLQGRDAAHTHITNGTTEKRKRVKGTYDLAKQFNKKNSRRWYVGRPPTKPRPSVMTDRSDDADLRSARGARQCCNSKRLARTIER